jgi:hypothetical protein
VKVLPFLFSILLLCTPACGTFSNNSTLDEGSAAETALTPDEGAPVDEGATPDPGGVDEGGTSACSEPTQVQTASGCTECNTVASNVSVQVSASANNHRTCEHDTDCATATPNTGCMGFCPFAVAENQKSIFLEAVAEVSEENCSDPDYTQKCGFVTPGCMGLDSRCVGGLCTLVEVFECPEPSPVGCKENGECEEGEVCKTIEGECFPSTCICDSATGSWICTGDCVGTCVTSPCPGENPQGCKNTGCPDGEVCNTNQGDKPSDCQCSSAGWNCTKDTGGGICVPK